MGCWVLIISLNTSNPGAKKQVVRRWGTEWVATVSVSLGHLKSVFHRIPSTTLHGFYIKKPQGKTATMPLTQYIRALDSPQFKRKIANFVFSSVSQNYFFPIFSSVQSLSHVQLFATAWTAAHQASHPSPTLGVYSNSCPLSQWCYPTISPSVIHGIHSWDYFIQGQYSFPTVAPGEFMDICFFFFLIIWAPKSFCVEMVF